MPIRVLQPADAVERVMRDQLATLAREDGLRLPAAGAAANVALSLALPHPVFNLSLAQVAEPGATQRAVMSGWRWLLTDGQGVLAAAEATASGPSSRAVFSHVNSGSFVQSAAASLREAEDWPEVKAGQFALGLLRVPVLNVMALWLRNEARVGEGDLFVPLAPAPQPLVAGAPIGVQEFESGLRQLAATRGQGEGASN